MGVEGRRCRWEPEQTHKGPKIPWRRPCLFRRKRMEEGEFFEKGPRE